MKATGKRGKSYNTVSLNSNRILVNSSTDEAAITLQLRRYRSALLFGTVNRYTGCFCLITRQHDDTVAVQTILDPGSNNITGLYDAGSGLVILKIPSNSSCVILF